MYKYLVKRLIYMVLMLVAVAVAIFIIMQLPPGNYFTTMTNALKAQGINVQDAQVDRLNSLYGLDRPLHIQFFLWISGFFRGNFGHSFAHNRPAIEIIAPAVRVSLLINSIVLVVSTAFVYLIGYFTAVHKNTVIDYTASFIGIVGSSVPSFVTALIALWIAFLITGQSFAGLYSREFLLAPMSWEKFIDGAKHLIIPVTVITFTGLAGFKGLRANFLDEINKPYVTTARAKGLSENKLLVKYPYRMSLIPQMGSIGAILPAIISGDAITGIVLNIPSLGPLLLNALKIQDIYLAGTILLIQCAMTIIGVLISDIALTLIDPRIRLEN